MADLQSLFEKIDSLKAELNSLRPFKKEDEERLWKKFRLEWNYNSNHIEGNTLTYGQTELLLIFGKTTGDQDVREIDEMRGHDVAIKLVQEYAADKPRELSEADIRQLNEIILVKPYWGNAMTVDGQQTRKLIQPGVYKREPNSVLLQNGEMFHYASPEETPAKMQELIDWFRIASLDKSLHPVYVAAKLHYDFVRIHPFDDSNGRTSRLLMNYVLLRNEFPPVIIKSADKKNYLNALNRADVGDFDAFVVYICNELIWSLKKSLKAGHGENPEDGDDLYKEISIWEKSIEKIDSKKSFSIDCTETVKDIFLDYLLPFFNELVLRYSQFNKVFSESRIYVLDSRDNGLNPIEEKIRDIEEVKHFFLERIRQYENDSLSVKAYHSWIIEFQYYGFLSKSHNETSFTSAIQIDITPLMIEIKSGNPQTEKALFWRSKGNGFNIDETVKKCIAEDFERIQRLK